MYLFIYLFMYFEILQSGMKNVWTLQSENLIRVWRRVGYNNGVIPFVPRFDQRI